MVVIEIPAARYVHHRHEGPTSGIAGRFGEIYAWAERHGHQVDAFKLDTGYTQEGGEHEHDLYVRIIK